MAQGNDEGNAFTFDDDEDMDFLLEQAANAGSAAVDEQHEGGDSPEELFGGVISTSPTTAPVAVTPPAPVEEPEPEPSFELDSFDLDKEFSSEPPVEEPKPTVTSVERDLEALRAETAAALEEPVVVPAPTKNVEEKRAEPAAEVPASRRTVQEVVGTTTSPTPRIIRQTEEEQIAHAKAILDAADEYRKLNAQERGVVAQLITQDAEYTDDAATIAIRAINADELTFSTMAALKTAKSHEPVDRAFYILGLPEDVRTSLGQLCSAFSGTELKGGDTLAFSRELVTEIEKLDSDAIGFVSATEAVLRAAKQR